MLVSQVPSIISSSLEFKVTKPTMHSGYQSNMMKLRFKATHRHITIANWEGSSMSSLATFPT